MASQFLPMLQGKWSDLVEEMQGDQMRYMPGLAVDQCVGLADGSGVDFISILALNVRTEIAFGMLSDGCTALSWKVESISALAQNWDVRMPLTLDR